MTVSIDYTKTVQGVYPGLRSIYSDYTNQATTGDTNENTLKSYAVPAGHGLYAGCKIIITSLAETTDNTVNAKTFRIKIGSNSYGSPSLASTLSCHRVTEIYIVTLATTQIFFPAGSQTAYGVTASAIATFTNVDLSGAFTISTTGQLGLGSEHLADRAFDISFWYAP